MKIAGTIILSVFLMLPLAGIAQQLSLIRRDSATGHLSYVVKPPQSVSHVPSTLLPQDFYAKNLSFFCRQELKMQEAHLPVSFRVGTMDQCNYLEQKPGYR